MQNEKILMKLEEEKQNLDKKIKGLRNEADKRFYQLLKELDDNLILNIHKEFQTQNPVLRDYVSGKMGLKLSSKKFGYNNKFEIEISFEIPEKIRAILESMPEEVWNIIINYQKIISAKECLDFIKRDFDRYDTNITLEYRKQSIEETQGLLSRIINQYNLQALFRTLLLNVGYIFGSYNTKSHKIEIYISAIIIFSALFNLDLFYLLRIVMVHEITHAFSHLGIDTDGMQWDTNSFIDADLNLIEGIAQFYTEQYSYDINLNDTFDKLLGMMSNEYTMYKTWPLVQGKPSEHLRMTMIAARTKNIVSYAEFIDVMISSEKLFFKSK